MYNISSLESALNKAQGFNMWMFVSFVLGLVAAILIFVLLIVLTSSIFIFTKNS